MIKNIIFDVGNVLVEYAPDRFMAEKGYTPQEQEIIKKAIFESRLWLEMDQGLHTTEESVAGYIANAPEHAALIRDAYFSCEQTVRAKDYATDWVKELQDRGYFMYVLSNYSEYLFNRTCQYMGFLEYMDGVVFSYRCKMIKPNPDIYHYICSACRLEPAESIFIDDMPANVQGAKACGMHGLQFTTFEETKSALEKMLLTY